MSRTRFPNGAFVVAICASLFGCPSDEPPPAPECTTTADCGDQEICAADGTCSLDVECGRDEDCTAADPRTRCEPETASCVFRTGFSDECGSAAPCAFGEFCSGLLGRCFESSAARDCTRRSQCPLGQLCDHAVNKCVEDLGCYGDAFCESGEVCDLVSRACRAGNTECVPCQADGVCDDGLCFSETGECLSPTTDPACLSGEFCDPFGRCVQCTSSSDCGPRFLYCNASIGRCESDVQCAPTPAQCPESSEVACMVCERPEICDLRTKRCQPPPTECNSDIDCTGETFCDDSLDPPICAPRLAACINDRQGEPNDRVTQAAPLLEAEGPFFAELTLCPTESDWYEVEVQAGTYVTIDARFAAADGDLDLQLFLDDGRTLVDESRSVTNNERVEIEAGTDLRLKLRVFFATRSLSPVPYTMIVGRQPGSICADDADEPDDTLPDATPIQSDTPYRGTLCSADPDWFVVRGVPAGSSVDATLDFPAGLGDLDLDLYRATSSVPIFSAEREGSGERLVYSTPFGGDFYVRVVGKAADTNVYTLRVNVRDDPEATCLDDNFEPNNAVAEGTFAPEDTGAVAAATLCQGDEDWFIVNLGPEEAIRAEIGFDPTNADLDLSLYRPGSDPATQPPSRRSDGIGPREAIALRADAAGDYLLRVYGTTPAQSAPYELAVFREPPLECEADAADLAGLGSSLADPIDLGAAPARADDVTICDADEDWYFAQLRAGFIAYVRLNFLSSDAELDIELFDQAGNLLISSAATPEGLNFREIAVRIPGFQGFAPTYARIFPRVAGDEATYSLTLDLVPLFTCDPDTYEPNESVALAAALTSSITGEIQPIPELTLCATDFDEDWFSITPPRPGARIVAELEHDSADLLLELRSPEGQVRACTNIGEQRCYSDGLGTSEHITFTATTTEPYYLRVSSIYSDPTVLTAPLVVDSPYRLSVAFETP